MKSKYLGTNFRNFSLNEKFVNLYSSQRIRQTKPFLVTVKCVGPNGKIEAETRVDANSRDEAIFRAGCRFKGMDFQKNFLGPVPSLEVSCRPLKLEKETKTGGTK